MVEDRDDLNLSPGTMWPEHAMVLYPYPEVLAPERDHKHESMVVEGDDFRVHIVMTAIVVAAYREIYLRREVGSSLSTAPSWVPC